jgi:DNA-directed RNA polymerase omega subunit
MCNFILQDCYKFLPNKFELVLVAAKRAKDISFKNTKLFVDPLKK